MPFDSKTGAAGGRKGGKNRWRGKDPASDRTKQLPLRVSPDELAMITEKADALDISRVELVVRAVKQYAPPE